MRSSNLLDAKETRVMRWCRPEAQGVPPHVARHGLVQCCFLFLKFQLARDEMLQIAMLPQGTNLY